MSNSLALSIKAVTAIVPRLSFPVVGVGAVQRYATPVFFADGLRETGYTGGGVAPGYDFDAMMAEPLNNTVVAAAVDAYARALPDAPLTLQNFDVPKKTDGTGGEWQRVEHHPALDIFNPDSRTALSETEVWGVTAAMKITRGEAFWFLAFNNAGTHPVEIIPKLPSEVRVSGDKNNFISGYEMLDGEGKWQPVSPDQVIHFRHLPHLNDFRHGWTPLSTGRPAMVGDNAVSTYHAAILLNAGVTSYLISVKAGEAQGQEVKVTQDQLQAFVDNWRRKYYGNKAASGSIEALSLPLEITKMGYSPDEMAVETLVDYYSSRLCSLMGIPRKLLDIGADPTYLNLKEAINDFWERRIVPDRNKDAATLNRQLLPLFFSDSERKKWRYAFDYSKVAALQENTDELFTRWGAVYTNGGIDRYTYLTKIGESDVRDDYKDVFAKQTFKMGEAPPVTAPPQGAASES